MWRVLQQLLEAAVLGVAGRMREADGVEDVLSYDRQEGTAGECAGGERTVVGPKVAKDGF